LQRLHIFIGEFGHASLYPGKAAAFSHFVLPAILIGEAVFVQTRQLRSDISNGYFPRATLPVVFPTMQAASRKELAF
jgi:hypothetical protein